MHLGRQPTRRYCRLRTAHLSVFSAWINFSIFILIGTKMAEYPCCSCRIMTCLTPLPRGFHRTLFHLVSRVDKGQALHSVNLPLSPRPLSADHFLSLERCHPAGHRLHSGQPELQARERCVDAGFLCGGEYLFPQVCTLDNAQTLLAAACWVFLGQKYYYIIIILLCLVVKAATSLQLTTSQTSASKHMLQWPSATSENCSASGQMTTW